MFEIQIYLYSRIFNFIYAYSRSDSLDARSGNFRSGILFVETENFVSTQDGRQSKHVKPFSNSVSTPGSFTAVKRGVNHLSWWIQRSQQFVSCVQKWWNSQNESRYLWFYSHEIFRKIYLPAYRSKHGKCSNEHILIFVWFVIISSIYIGMHWHKVIMLSKR